MTQSRGAGSPAYLALVASVALGCSSEPPAVVRAPSSRPASARTASPPLALSLFIASDGVYVKTRAGDIAPGCEHPGPDVAVAHKGGVLDEGALRTCVTRLNAAAPDAKGDTSVTVSAAPETPYQTIVAAMDAVRKTASGETLFSDVTFGLPPAARAVSPVSGASSAMPPPSVSLAGPSDEGVVVLVSKRSLSVDGIFVASVPPDADRGFESDCKRNGRGDLYVVPFGKALKRWAEQDLQVRMATGKDPSFSEAIVIADASTPYRLLAEVFFTLGASNFDKFHLMVQQK